MIGMILVTHGRLAEEFVHAMEHVVGTQPDVATVCIGPQDDMGQRRKDIAQAIKRVDLGQRRGDPDRPVRRHALEPRDLAAQEAGKTEVIAGINLPMLIRLAGARKDMDLRRRGRRRARRGAQLHHHRLRVPRTGRITAGRAGEAALERHSREVTIVNKRGLHARASAKFVAAVAGMDGCQVAGAQGRAHAPRAARSSA